MRTTVDVQGMITFIPSTLKSIPLPGGYHVELGNYKTGAGEMRTRATLRGPEVKGIISDLVGNCPTLALTPLLDDGIYPLGFSSNRRASSLAANLVANA